MFVFIFPWYLVKTLIWILKVIIFQLLVLTDFMI